MNPDFKLFEANTGVQALEVMEREDIHLILLDIMMPEMDGISAMVKLSQACGLRCRVRRSGKHL